MPKKLGRIVSIDFDGNIEIRLPDHTIPDVGTKFNVLNEDGKIVAEIKVIEASSSKIIARNFL
jgi:hypothetical protein